MSVIPNSRRVMSPDNRRVAEFQPHTMDLGNGTPAPAYRLMRTVRTRRGFGTTIHSITTFVRSKKRAQQLASAWVKARTDERNIERAVRRVLGR